MAGLIVCWEKDSKAETIEKNKSESSVLSELVNNGFDQPLLFNSNLIEPTYSEPIIKEDLDKSIALSSVASDSGHTEQTETQNTERWSSFLPLMADEAKKRGYELPLPFGVGISFLMLKRDIEVTDVEAGLNSDPQPVPVDLALDTKTFVSNMTFRFDTWLLPFFNLYAIAGYTQSESRVNVQFTIPTPGPGPDIPVDLDIEGTLDGPTIGGGMTLATGYQNFFLTVDGNYSYTDLGGIFDEAVNAIVVSAKTGWHGPVGKTKLAVWIGGTYWDTKREVTGSIPVGSNTVFFKVEQGPINPVNLNFGTNVEISKTIGLVADVGANFDDMNSLILALIYRF